MGLNIYLNADTVDSPQETSGIDWVELDTGNDSLIFSNGNDNVADGEIIPSQAQIISAGLVLNGTEQTISKAFLADASTNLLKEIHNMGNKNKRYVLAFVFDSATASEPVLEMWDNTSLNTINATSLGAGTPTNSYYKGVVTTDALPGVDWFGSPLAGSADGNFLWLNNGNGALTGAETLYCNLKVVVPASVVIGGSYNPIIVCKYLDD